MSEEIKSRYALLYGELFEKAQDAVQAQENIYSFLNRDIKREYMQKAKAIFGTETLMIMIDGQSQPVTPDDAANDIFNFMVLGIEGSSSYLSDSSFVYGQVIKEPSTGKLSLDKDSDAEAWDEVYNLVPPICAMKIICVIRRSSCRGSSLTGDGSTISTKIFQGSSTPKVGLRLRWGKILASIYPVP